MGPTKQFEAVIFDLDGTLVDLAVDWSTVHRDVDAALSERGVPTEGLDLWRLWELGKESGHSEVVNKCIAEHEITGARTSTRLPAADSVPDMPIGVCTLNAEQAALTALSTHELSQYVDEGAVIGRDSVATEKPHPEPLLTTCRALDVEPSMTVFVGDGERDEMTAQQAGVPFRYVSEWLPSPSSSDLESA
jgi:phosphoglycolate phosphatase